MAETMRAWLCAHPGPVAKTVQLSDTAPRPSKPLQDGQILVQVVAAGINPADYKTLDLGLASRAIASFPKTPGMDLSGKVVEAGPNVEDTKPGDRIFARMDPLKKEGSLAEYVVLNRESYATLPEGCDMEEAGGAPTASLTAYQTIAPYVKPGDKIFINGGSGGVGTFGIQVAKALGCHVTVSCSTGKAEGCKALGADEIIDYKTSDVLTELNKKGQNFVLVVDNVGNSPPNLYASSHNFLVPDGKFVFVGGSVTLGSATSLTKSLFLPGFLGGGKRKFIPFMTKNVREDLQRIAGWMGEGKVTVQMDSVFGFEETREAFEHLKKGSSSGKVVVRVEKQ